jgi:hypothetical protein
MNNQTAIQFYNENAQYVENFGLSNLDREDRILFRKGKVLVNDLISPKRNKLEFYNQQERIFIAIAYHKGMTRKEIVSSFIRQFGNRHTPDSIGQKCEMCKSVDSNYTQHKNFQFRDTELLTILQELDSTRYALN